MSHAVADLVEEAAALATADPGRAAERAQHAASLLPDGHDERHAILAFAAQLFDLAARQHDAADAWADAASAATDPAARARCLARQGEAARLAGRWAEAETAHREAVALADQHFGAGSRETAAASHNLAVTYKYTGRFDEAERLHLGALDVATAIGDDAFAATILHNLGGLAHARGAHADGERWARRSVELRERTGDDPVALAADRGALAALLIGLDRHDEAETLLLEAHATFVAELGAGHHEVGVVEGNLAAVALARHALEDAEAHARRALALKEAHLGPAHPELAPTLTTLGTIRRRRGDGREAAALHQRAIAVLEPSVDPDHPLLETIRANLRAARAAG